MSPGAKEASSVHGAVFQKSKQQHLLFQVTFGNPWLWRGVAATIGPGRTCSGFKIEGLGHSLWGWVSCCPKHPQPYSFIHKIYGILLRGPLLLCEENSQYKEVGISPKTGTFPESRESYLQKYNFLVHVFSRNNEVHTMNRKSAGFRVI